MSETTTSASSGRHPSVLRAAGSIGIATLLSRILGLVREQVFAVLFGAGNLTDAFNVAFRIPNLLRNLFAEGAMSASLVPTFTQARAQEGERGAWRVAGLVFRVLTGIVGLLALLGIIFAPQLVSLYASAFRQVPGKYELTVSMTRILFPYFPLVTLAAAYMGILNACGVFFLPALSSALFNLFSIVVGVGLAEILFDVGPRWGIQPIIGMAWGVLAGGLVQAFCQLPALYRAGYRWQPRRPEERSWRQDPHLRRMMLLMAPSVLGLAATQVSMFINTVLATTQGPGAVSWLHYAFRLMQFPIGIFGASLASAILPVVSRQWVARDVRAVEATLTQGLKHVFAINLPASAGLAFLGGPIIGLIFEYGRFTHEDTRATALALAMYAIGLTAYSAIKLLVPACYALGNARVPVIASFIAVGVTVAFNLILIRPLGFWGLALGTSVGAIVNMALLVQALHRLLKEAGGGLPTRSLARSCLQHLCVALIMGVAAYFSHDLLNAWLPDRILGDFLGKTGWALMRLMKVSLVMAESLVVVLGISHVLGIEETVQAMDIFAKKIKKKLRARPS